MDRPSAILMGSKPGSVVALSILLERGWNVTSVVASRKVNHPWLTGQGLEEMAAENNIKVVGSQDELLSGGSADFVISYMFRYKVKADTRNLARRAALNFHAGPLPRFGGWAFYNVAILENADEYGCTCHYMDDGFDTGPLLKVRRFPIEASKETAFSLEQKTQEEMLRLFIDFCRLAETRRDLPIEEQDRSEMRYLSRHEFEALKEIPADADEVTVDRYARAFWYPPYECAYASIRNLKLEVVPAVVKHQLASLSHAGELERLQEAARTYFNGRNE